MYNSNSNSNNVNNLESDSTQNRAKSLQENSQEESMENKAPATEGQGKNSYKNFIIHKNNNLFKQKLPLQNNFYVQKESYMSQARPQTGPPGSRNPYSYKKSGGLKQEPDVFKQNYQAYDKVILEQFNCELFLMI